MSWAEVKKINSDMTTPLDVTLGKREDAVAASINNTNSIVSNIKGAWNGLVNLIGAANPTVANYATVMNYCKTLENAILARPVSPIKSIQRGTASLTAGAATVTITAVNMSKAFLDFNYRNGGSVPADGLIEVGGILASTTSVTFTGRNYSGLSTVINWQVIEYN